MKYVTAFLMVVLCVMGSVALVLFTRDNPQYADGEPTAIVKDWLAKQPKDVLPATDGASVAPGTDGVAPANEEQPVWTEEYAGNGKWTVSKASIRTDYSKTDMTFEEWIVKTKGWDANRLTEYASDLSPEDQKVLQENLRTYNSGQPDIEIKQTWYVYEKSGLVEEARN